MTPKEVLDLGKKNDVKIVDLRFMDFPGLMQHFSIPVDKLTEEIFEEGIGFDGSSIRGDGGLKKLGSDRISGQGGLV